MQRENRDDTKTEDLLALVTELRKGSEAMQKHMALILEEKSSLTELVRKQRFALEEIEKELTKEIKKKHS